MNGREQLYGSVLDLVNTRWHTPGDHEDWQPLGA